MPRSLVSLAVIYLLFAASADAQHPDSGRARDTVRLAEIRIVGAPDAMARIPGSAEVIGREALAAWRPFTLNEPLRRVSGLHLRDEEGLGLRPNIGFRGLNPTRSTKVLLLEDGIPLTFAPYGDNASYYHPPVNRFERIEVLKGSGQILFGPQTVGGVINYVTPAAPRRAATTMTMHAGNGGAFGGMLTAGGTAGRVGILGSLSHRDAEGARAATSSRQDDASLKTTIALGEHQHLTIRGNAYRERSNVSYSGLTEAEWQVDPRQNPFVHDSMFLDRAAGSLTHRAGLSRRATLTTTAYVNAVRRHWWRQSSNSAERPNDASDPACGGMQNLSTACGNQGRLRFYRVAGIEPRFQAGYQLLGMIGLVDAGVRLHVERQQRRQLNGDSATSREAGSAANANAGVREDNIRSLTAWSAFVQNRWQKGNWSLTPGIRLERVSYHRENRLASPPVSGRNDITQLIPGLGLTFEPVPTVTLFAGVHRGFAPPRTEDVIDNGTGGAIDLDAELSWNSEIGVRAALGGGGWLKLQATAFRMDFENQIVPASVAGGTGAALTNGGRTLQQGAELSANAVMGRWHAGAALTWLPAARFIGTTRDGNRLPYAPEATLTASAGYSHGALDARIEAVAIGGQHGDAQNTTTASADGQRGPIPGFTIWNAAATWHVARTRASAFVAVQNLFDRLYVADRTRGLLPGAPRRVQAGLQLDL